MKTARSVFGIRRLDPAHLPQFSKVVPNAAPLEHNPGQSREPVIEEVRDGDDPTNRR